MSRKKSRGPCLVPRRPCLVPIRLRRTCVGFIHKFVSDLPQEETRKAKKIDQKIPGEKEAIKCGKKL